MKNELRKKSKLLRDTLDVENLSNKILENLLSLKEYINAKNIFSYYSFSSEVKTEFLFKDKAKNWYLPRINGNDIEVCPFCKNELFLNKYQILEPKTKKLENLDKIDLIIVPALCVDKKGYRVGYGKGFYDRFFKTLKHNPIKVILTYSALLVDDIKPQEHDVPCNIIVTENDILYINL